MNEGKHYLSADGYLRDSWRLAAAVRASGWRPDTLIALWRGGASVGIAVHEFFKATGWDMRSLALKSTCYTGIGTHTGEVVFTLGDEVFALLSKGEKVLVVDDVFDTGMTAKAVKERIEATGAEFRFASVYWKSSKNETDVEPDYFVRDPGDEWIVFPHEIEGLTKDERVRKDPVLAALLDADEFSH